MARVEAYLVRGPDGRMLTVRARSVNGAKKIYLQRKRPKRGQMFSVKPRGHGDWAYFDVI